MWLMPIVPRNRYTKYQLKTKELVTYYCGYHGNLVTMSQETSQGTSQGTSHGNLVTMSQGTSIPNMDSIRLKTKELQRGGARIETRLAFFPSGCISFSREDGDERRGTLKHCDSTN